MQNGKPFWSSFVIDRINNHIIGILQVIYAWLTNGNNPCEKVNIWRNRSDCKCIHQMTQTQSSINLQDIVLPIANNLITTMLDTTPISHHHMFLFINHAEIREYPLVGWVSIINKIHVITSISESFVQLIISWKITIDTNHTTLMININTNQAI